MTNSRLRVTKTVLWTIVGALGVLTIARFANGLGVTTSLTDSTPWGFWIAFDVMAGVALAAGGFVLAGSVYIFGLEKYRPFVRPARGFRVGAAGGSCLERRGTARGLRVRVERLDRGRHQRGRPRGRHRRRTGLRKRAEPRGWGLRLRVHADRATYLSHLARRMRSGAVPFRQLGRHGR